MKHIISVVILILASLACTVQAATPEPISAPIAPVAPKVTPAETDSTRAVSVNTETLVYTAVISADVLTFRQCPGTSCAPIPEMPYLYFGSKVIVGEKRVVDDPECSTWRAVRFGTAAGWVCEMFLGSK